MIKIISVGKIKEQYLKDGIDEYLKRISKYTKIEIIELKDEEAKPNINETLINNLKIIEGNRILNNIKNEYVIALDRQGIELSSIDFASKLESIYTTISSNIAFIIGGSYGLSDEVLKRANLKISFSKLTFPHQLFRLVLLEQIYRAYKILNNEIYHK